jgi:hypothetical protein
MDKYNSFHKTPVSPHFGIHYFEDTTHYRELDLLSWLPELTNLGITWVNLLSEKGRAIPEAFLKGLVQAGISVNIRFTFTFKDAPTLAEITPLLQSYAAWGVKTVQFFDRPNEKSSWNASSWTDQDMIGKYLDILLPYITLANQHGLQTILPPLQPGGSYWDTIFLRSMLSSIMERGEQKLLDTIILSAYAWTGKHSLNWGAGGAAKWPTARPYFSPPDVEDQRGFRIFDWYNEIMRSEIGMELPIVLYHCGIPADPFLSHPIQFTEKELISCNQEIFNLLHPELTRDEISQTQPLPANILACSFWILSARDSDAWQPQAWFHENGSPTLLGKAMQEKTLTSVIKPQKRPSLAVTQAMPKANPTGHQNGNHPLKEYILLPKYDWGIADFHLDAIRPYIKKYQPTIGFSMEEAKFARQVLIIGGEQTFPISYVNELKAAGCSVERISGDGTEIATNLAER